MTFGEKLEMEREEGRAEGRAEGLAEGREEGRAEGLAEGRAEALTVAVDRIIEIQKITLEEACALIGITIEQYNSTKGLA